MGLPEELVVGGVQARDSDACRSNRHYSLLWRHVHSGYAHLEARQTQLTTRFVRD